MLKKTVDLRRLGAVKSTTRVRRTLQLQGGLAIWRRAGTKHEREKHSAKNCAWDSSANVCVVLWPYRYSAIGGGMDNTANANYTIVAGGSGNFADAR